MAATEDKPYIAVTRCKNSDYDGFVRDYYPWYEYSATRCDKKGLDMIAKFGLSKSVLRLGLELKLTDFLTKKFEAMTKEEDE